MASENTHTSSPIERCISGIDAFDDALNGGLPRKSMTLLTGVSGTGKSVLAKQWLFSGGLKQEEIGLFISCSRTEQRVIEHGSHFTFFQQEALQNAKIVFRDIRELLESISFDEGSASIERANFIAEKIYELVKEVKAKRLVIDSITDIAFRLQSRNLIRAFLSKLSTLLFQDGVTTLLISDATNNEMSIFGVEEFVVDGIIELSYDLNTQPPIRRLSIRKLRDSNFMTHSLSFRITADGIKFYPIFQYSLNHPVFTEQLSTGIDKLDEMSGGGFTKGSSILITGPSGVGKSLMSLQFALKAMQNEKKTLILSMEESPDQMFRNAQAFNWNFKEYSNKGLLRIISTLPTDEGLEHLAFLARSSTDEFDPDIFIFDALSCLMTYYEEREIRHFMAQLTAFFKQKHITSVYVNTSEVMLGGYSISDARLSTIIDEIIMLRYLEIESELRHGVLILKKRGAKHAKKMRELFFTKEGITLGNEFSHMEGLISGNTHGLEKMTQNELVNVTRTLNNSSLVATTDKEGNIMYVNSKFMEVSKYSEEELLGQNHRILKSGFHTPEFFEMMWKTISDGKIWHGDIRNKAKDGSIYWVRSTIMPTFDEHENIHGYSAVRTPISDVMKPYEEAVRKLAKGEEVDPEMREIIEELKTGVYDKYKWDYLWVHEEK